MINGQTVHSRDDFPQPGNQKWQHQLYKDSLMKPLVNWNLISVIFFSFTYQFIHSWPQSTCILTTGMCPLVFSVWGHRWSSDLRGWLNRLRYHSQHVCSMLSSGPTPQTPTVWGDRGPPVHLQSTVWLMFEKCLCPIQTTAPKVKKRLSKYNYV